MMVDGYGGRLAAWEKGDPARHLVEGLAHPRWLLRLADQAIVVIKD
jgi:hypothetical protein